MQKREFKLNPKHALGIIRRYLHVLALLQNNKDPQDWNSNTLADIISYETDKPVDDKVIRGDIDKYLENDLGLSISSKRGARRSELSSEMDNDTLLTLLMTYTDFVMEDSSRMRALKSIIESKKDICLWLFARIHFAKMKRNKINFDYTTNSNRRINITVHPYHIVCRENKIYLVGMRDSDNTVGPYILARVENLKVLDAEFGESVPDIHEIFKHSLSGFLWNEATEMTIRYKAHRENYMRNEFSSLDPEVKTDGEWNEMTFMVFDPEAVCRQLFFYGADVVITAPEDIRIWMIDSLKQSLSMYQKNVDDTGE